KAEHGQTGRGDERVEGRVWQVNAMPGVFIRGMLSPQFFLVLVVRDSGPPKGLTSNGDIQLGIILLDVLGAVLLGPERVTMRDHRDLAEVVDRWRRRRRPLQ